MVGDGSRGLHHRCRLPRARTHRHPYKALRVWPVLTLMRLFWTRISAVRRWMSLAAALSRRAIPYAFVTGYGRRDPSSGVPRQAACSEALSPRRPQAGLEEVALAQGRDLPPVANRIMILRAFPLAFAHLQEAPVQLSGSVRDEIFTQYIAWLAPEPPQTFSQFELISSSSSSQ